jgi:hypothetical protein
MSKLAWTAGKGLKAAKAMSERVERMVGASARSVKIGRKELGSDVDEVVLWYCSGCTEEVLLLFLHTAYAQCIQVSLCQTRRSQTEIAMGLNEAFPKTDILMLGSATLKIPFVCG